jgi:hypothetical protein
MAPSRSSPARTLRERPDIVQLRRQAKELLAGFVAGQADVVAEVNAHYHPASTMRLCKPIPITVVSTGTEGIRPDASACSVSHFAAQAGPSPAPLRRGRTVVLVAYLCAYL